MKKIFFFLSAILFGAQFIMAQDFEDIQKAYLLGQNTRAKTDIDKAMGNSKFSSKAQSWMLKSCIYAALSMDPTNKNTQASFDLANDADAAFTKYREMEPSMKMVSDPMYQNGPINIYSFLYNAGYEDYKKNKWAEGYDKLKRALKYSDLLIADTIIKSRIDTNLLILAGVTAENSNHKDDAFKFYGKLADNKVTGQGFESVYKFLVSQSFMTKDMVSFEKYKTLGKELYPKSEYFSYDKVDFANGLDSTLEGKMKALEEILASDPNNYKANEFLGEDIYDALNPKDEKTPLPANTDALETKMINVFTKASAAEPNNEIPLLNLGNYFINKSIKIDKDRKDLNAELKTKYKPGTPVSKEDAAKRDALDKKYLDVLEEARPRYEKTVDIFKARATLTITQKAQYKSIVTSLSDIALYKQTYYRGKPSEVAKYTAEQKKWDALYETISSNPTNNTPTTSSIKGQANFIREGKLMKIKSKINGLSLDMIFDTGASDVSISLTEALFMLKNGYLDSDDIIGKSSFSTADGSIGDGYTLNIRQLEFGGIILKNIKATVVKTLDAPILLGQSALQSFGKITIDNNKSVIVLQ